MYVLKDAAERNKLVVQMPGEVQHPPCQQSIISVANRLGGKMNQHPMERLQSERLLVRGQLGNVPQEVLREHNRFQLLVGFGA